MQTIKFKEEQKKAQAVMRELEKLEMKESGQASHKNIILPKYVMNQDLKVYEEIEAPPKSIYKAVGYNDMQRVKAMMEGDEKEKRNANSDSIKKSKTLAANNKAENDLAVVEEEHRRTNVTNLHYRKFYEDELENDRQLFPDPDDPFIKIPIKKG